MRRNVTIHEGLHEGVRATGALIALLFWSGLVQAGEPPAAARYPIEQASQDLSDSLRSIARQTGISVLFDPGVVHGRLSHPVSGRLSAAEAIARALDGTGLVADVMKDGAIVVRPVETPRASPTVPVRTVPSSFVQAASAGSPTAVTAATLAQASVQDEHRADVVSPSDGSGDSRAGQRIEITGSRIRRVAAEGPLPVNTYTAADIDRSGQPTLERFLNSLNETSVTPGEGALSGTFGQGAVQLRGLPLGSTLVLINGRRVQAVGSSSANLFNLNLIPMAAVERVEVVPVGSSAVYGGDALAGVVNVILKKSIDGYSASARLASGRGIGDGQFSLATGGRGDQGSFVLLGALSKSTPLTMAERSFFQDGDFRRFGGPDARTRSCTPGTVSSTTAGNLPGLTSTFAGIPEEVPGQPLTVASFAATAGQANLCYSQANGNGYALVHGMQSASLHASGDRRITDDWDLFGELTYSHDKLRAEETGLLLSNVLVPASNPYNPFGVSVRVSARLGLDNGTEGMERDTDYARALLGVRGALGAGWDLEATASTSRDKGERRQLNGTVNSAARTAALAASAPELALNPFTAGRAASEEVLRGIWSDGLRHNRGQKDQLGAFVRGPVAKLPAGPVDAIVGAEYARDAYETSTADVSYLASRRSSALYGEFLLPLLRAEPSAGRSWSLAALTMAARQDHYSDFGGAGTYQAGIEVRPARNLLLRGAAASSFKPPTLLQTGVDERSFTTDDFGLLDPALGNAPITGGEVLRTTNHDLGPEKGRAYSLGAVWEPEAGSGARLGVTTWRVRIDGLIALLWPQITLDNEALFPGFVTRGPAVGGSPGPVTRVLYAEVNFGRVETAGTDIEASQSWSGLGGRWTASASATRASLYRVSIAPGAATEDRLGRRSPDFWAPKWKGRASLGFEEGSWSLGVTSRYLGAYKDAGASERKLGDSWVHDLAGSLDLKKLGWLQGPAAKAATLSLGVVNLMNRQPQFVETSPYYDVTQADWRGRYASARLSVDW